MSVPQARHFALQALRGIVAQHAPGIEFDFLPNWVEDAFPEYVDGVDEHVFKTALEQLAENVTAAIVSSLHDTSKSLRV